MKKTRFLDLILIFTIVLSFISCKQEMPSAEARAIEDTTTRIELIGGGRFSWTVDGNLMTGTAIDEPVLIRDLSPGLHSIAVTAEPGMSESGERTNIIDRVLLFSIGEDRAGGTVGKLDFSSERNIAAVLSGFSFDPQWKNSILFAKTGYAMGESGFDSIVLYDDGTGEYRPDLSADEAAEIGWYLDGDIIVLADTQGSRRYGTYDGEKVEFRLSPATGKGGFSEYRILRGTPGSGIDGKWLIPALSLNADIPPALGFARDIISDIGIDFEIEIEWDEAGEKPEKVVPRILGIDFGGVSTPVLYKEETGLPADIPSFSPHMRLTLELLPMEPPEAGGAIETAPSVTYPDGMCPAVSRIFNAMDWQGADYALSRDGAFLLVSGYCNDGFITLTLARSGGNDSPFCWNDPHTFKYDMEVNALELTKAWTDIALSPAIRPLAELTMSAKQIFNLPWIGIWEIKSGETTEKWYYNGENAWSYDSEDRTGEVTATGQGTPWDEADRDNYWLNVFVYVAENYDATFKSIRPIINGVPQGEGNIKTEYEFLNQPEYVEADGTWNVKLELRCFSVPDGKTDYWQEEDETTIWTEEKTIKARKIAGADSKEYIEENNFFMKGNVLSLEKIGLMKDGSTALWRKSLSVPEDNSLDYDTADGAWGHDSMHYIKYTNLPATLEGAVSNPTYQLSGDELGIFFDIDFDKMRDNIFSEQGKTLPDIVALLKKKLEDNFGSSTGVEEALDSFPPAILKLVDLLMPIAESFERGWPDLRVGIYTECSEGYIEPLDCAGNGLKIELRELI